MAAATSPLSRPPRHASIFSRLARGSARAAGEPAAFVAATGLVLLWAVTGPLFHFSDTWQLVINTGTTVLTFLMVFLIQATQNQDSAAAQLKLDEIIRAIGAARNAMLDMEDMDPQDLDHMKDDYQKLARHARSGKSDGRSRSGSPQRGRAPARRKRRQS